MMDVPVNSKNRLLRLSTLSDIFIGVCLIPISTDNVQFWLNGGKLGPAEVNNAAQLNNSQMVPSVRNFPSLLYKFCNENSLIDNIIATV